MVQLKAMPTTPKSTTKMAKNKSPKAVSMKAKDKVSPKKKVVETILSDTKEEVENQQDDIMDTSTKTPKKNKKNKTPQKVKEVESQEDEDMETSTETPKKNKKNKKSPKKVESKTEETSNQDTEDSEDKSQDTKQEKSHPARVRYDYCAHVKGLNFKSTKEEVQEFFKKYGLLNTSMPRNLKDRSHANSGYCYLHFKEEKNMWSAISSENKLHGRVLKVEVAIPKAEKKRKLESDDNGPQKKKSAGCPEKSVYLGGLNPITTEKTLKEHFSKYGKIVDVVVMGKPGQSKGYGFMEFANKTSAEKALEHTHTIDDKEIACLKKIAPISKNATKSSIQKDNEIMAKLSFTINKQDFEKYFNGLGDIASITFPEVKGNPQKKNKGFAFVSFKTEEKMNEVLAMEHEINDLKITVKSAKKPEGEIKTLIQKKKKEIKKLDHEILVKDLPKMLSRDEFMKAFSQFGKILKVTLPLKKRATPAEGIKGFGFLAFETAEQKQKALADSFMMIKKTKAQIVDADDKPKDGGVKGKKNKKKAPKTEATSESEDTKQEVKEESDE